MFPISEKQLSNQNLYKPMNFRPGQEIFILSNTLQKPLKTKKKERKKEKGANSQFLSSSEFVQDCQTKRMIFVLHLVKDLFRRETKEQYSNELTPYLPQRSSEWSHS